MTATGTYGAYPVLLLEPDWQGPSFGDTTTVTTQRLDNMVSDWLDDQWSTTAIGERSVRWFLDGRAAITDFRALLTGLAGRRSAFWMPTWVTDLHLTQSEDASSNHLSFRFCAFSRYYLTGNAGRRYLALAFPDQSFLYRQVVGSVDNGDGTETLETDVAHGVDIDAEAVRPMFLTLCRLKEDRVDIQWHNFVLATVETALREVPGEAPAV